MKNKAIPIERLTVRWVEQLSADHEVIRVLMVGNQAVYRVVPHRVARWRAESFDKHYWRALRTKARKGAWNGTERTWRSPESAMRTVEAEFRQRWMLLPGGGT